MDGLVELSLGCLKYALNTRERDRLQFPLILQVLDSSMRGAKRGQYKQPRPSNVISISDGFYKRTDCFLLESDERIEPYSIISISNIDFDVPIVQNRVRDARIKIVGAILQHEILVPGSSIGYYSGNPISLDQFEKGAMEIKNQLSDKLWSQVKQGKCCDVTFKFTDMPGEPVVLAQKSPLIVHSDVFEAQFEGGYLENSGVVKITDSEPKYMACLVQYIFTEFVPLTSLEQAFEVLYLANKYMLKDLEKFCRNFIIKNKVNKNVPKDIYKYMELNVKCCDDDISSFILQEFARHADVFIRQPAFLECTLSEVEMFLSQVALNAHEWEIIQAVRRWAIHKGLDTNCDPARPQCLHQLLECIRWKGVVPLREAVLANSWPEFGLFKNKDFLTSVLMAPTRVPLEIDRALAANLNRNYSLHRRQSSHIVVYTSLAVDRVREQVECLHGAPVAEQTRPATKCSSVGPPFEVQGSQLVPSYGIERMKQETGGDQADLVLRVSLCCDNKANTKASTSRSPPTFLEVGLHFKIFSFSSTTPAKEKEIILKFSQHGFSHCAFDTVIPLSQLSNFLYVWEGKTQIDLQMRFVDVDCIQPKKATILRNEKLQRSRNRTRSRDDNSINIHSGVGPVLRRLRGSETASPGDSRRPRRHDRSTSAEDVIWLESPGDNHHNNSSDMDPWSPVQSQRSLPYSPWSPRSPRSPRLYIRSPSNDIYSYHSQANSPIGLEGLEDNETPQASSPSYESLDDRAVMWGSPRSPSSNNSYPYTPPHEEPYTPPHEEEEPYTPPHDEEGSRSPQPGPSGLGRSGRLKRSRSSSGHKSRKGRRRDGDSDESDGGGGSGSSSDRRRRSPSYDVDSYARIHGQHTSDDEDDYSPPKSYLPRDDYEDYDLNSPKYTPFDESGAEVDAATGHDAEAGGEAEPTLPLTDDDNSNSSQ